MNQQIANYIRGKVIEIVITGAVTYIAFAYLGLQQRCWPCWSACRWWCRTSARWW